MKLIKKEINKAYEAIKTIIGQLEEAILNDDEQALDHFELPEAAVHYVRSTESTMSFLLYRLIGLVDKKSIEQDTIQLKKLIEALEALITNGVNLKTTYSEGVTPLMLAASIYTTGRVAVLNALLKGSNDINAADDSNKTALYYALSDFYNSFNDPEQIKRESAQLLIQHGARLDNWDEEITGQPNYDKLKVAFLSQQVALLQQEVAALRTLVPELKALQQRVITIEAERQGNNVTSLRRVNSVGSFF